MDAPLSVYQTPGIRNGFEVLPSTRSEFSYFDILRKYKPLDSPPNEWEHYLFPFVCPVTSSRISYVPTPLSDILIRR